MTETVEKRVCALIADRLEIDADAVTTDSTPDELGIDSLKMVDLIFSLEEEFDVTIPFNANDADDSGFQMTKVGDVVKIMTELTAGGQ